jgi:hypothetical protein
MLTRHKRIPKSSTLLQDSKDETECKLVGISLSKAVSKEKRVGKKAFYAKKKALTEEFLKTVDDKIAKRNELNLNDFINRAAQCTNLTLTMI